MRNPKGEQDYPANKNIKSFLSILNTNYDYKGKYGRWLFRGDNEVNIDKCKAKIKDIYPKTHRGLLAVKENETP